MARPIPRPPPVTSAVRPLSASGIGRRPRWRDQAPPVDGARGLGVGGLGRAIPELAGHRLVALIEALAVVRELAAADEVTQAEPDLAEPVGVREGLARR